MKAFGLNRFELHTRLGLAQGVTFPRVLGIEAVAIVDAAPGSDLEPGQQVATLMGGMGRTFDGGYAEYTVVPGNQVVPFTSDLPWEVIGAVPESLQTAYGSLTTGLDLSRGQTLLVRAAPPRSAWPRAPSRRRWVPLSLPRLAGRIARRPCWTTEPTTSSSTMVRSSTRSTTSWAQEWMPHWSLWASRPFPTHSAPPVSTAPSVSLGCCRTGGRSGTSIPSTTYPPA